MHFNLWSTAEPLGYWRELLRLRPLSRAAGLLPAWFRETWERLGRFGVIRWRLLRFASRRRWLRWRYPNLLR